MYNLGGIFLQKTEGQLSLAPIANYIHCYPIRSAWGIPAENGQVPSGSQLLLAVFIGFPLAQA
ncbi:hypothetical protein J2TS4_43350 [Paenibacillus sp. J2TS4]|nr:hypothetical protein J2TS4_43350 [Paenibacillus sp. J2TS4]